MKPIYKYIAIIISTVILTFLLTKSCQPGISIPNSYTLVKQAGKQQAVITHEIEQAKVIHDTIIKERHHYHEVRRDSLIPCETKLIICDTLLVHDSILDTRKDAIIADMSALVGTWKQVHSIDSTANRALVKDNKRLKRKLIFWKVIAGLEAGVIGYGAVKP